MTEKGEAEISQDQALGAALVKAGLITDEQLKKAERFQKDTSAPIGRILVKFGYITSEKYTQFIAKREGLPLVPENEEISAADQFCETNMLKVMDQHAVLPSQEGKDSVTLITHDPTDYNAIEEVKFLTGKKVDLKVAPLTQIRRAIHRAHDKCEARDYEGIVNNDLDTIHERKKIIDELDRAMHEMHIERRDLLGVLPLLLVEKGLVSVDELIEYAKFVATSDILRKVKNDS